MHTGYYGDIEERDIRSITERTNKTIAENIAALRRLSIFKLMEQSANRYVDITKDGEMSGETDLDEFFKESAYENGEWKRFASAIDNDANIKAIENLVKDAEKAAIYIKNISMELLEVYKKEKEYIESAETVKLVNIYKRNSSICLTCGDFDKDSEEYLKIDEVKNYDWSERKKVTDMLIQWNVKYSVKYYVAKDYELTAKAREVFSEYIKD